MRVHHLLEDDHPLLIDTITFAGGIRRLGKSLEGWSWSRTPSLRERGSAMQVELWVAGNWKSVDPDEAALDMKRVLNGLDRMEAALKTCLLERDIMGYHYIKVRLVSPDEPFTMDLVREAEEELML